MRIFLIRHAHAVDEGPRLGDEHRYLTAKGRKLARAIGRRLKEEGVELDVVLASPLVRAVQTAELFAGALDYVGTVEASPALAPGVPPRVAAEELVARAAQSLAVVGHEPGISAIGAFLVGRPSFPPFKKAQVCLLDNGRPAWTLDPDSLTIERLFVA